MKKMIMKTFSLLMVLAMTAAFSMTVYFAVAEMFRTSADISDPLPDEGTDFIPEDGGSTAPPANIPDVLPPDDEENDAPSGEVVDEDEEKKHGSVYIRSKTNGLNIRSGAGTNYPSLGSLDKNDMLSYKGQSGGWYITEYRSKTAYVSASNAYTELYEMEHEIDETIEKVIAEGYALLGHPYVYGAVRLHDGRGNFLKNFNAEKYDCSSLMQYIYYYGAGVVLDITTRTQVVQGEHVAKNDLKRGDLMFFTNSSRYNKTGIERIGHVALYLGDNYILHTATDHAVIEPISTRRWNYYIETRRVA